MRRATVERKTNETAIRVEVDLDGTGQAEISTGVGFFDHMLDQVARHALFDLNVEAKGDLHIDDHHTVEDTGIALGQAIREALGDKRGVVRYADCHLAMDEALTRVSLDFSGRPFLVFRTAFTTGKIGTFDTELVREFFQAFAVAAVSRSEANARRTADALAQAGACSRSRRSTESDAGGPASCFGFGGSMPRQRSIRSDTFWNVT